jgi:hypothetical protein
VDKGPWYVIETRGRFSVVSDDFNHDVLLTISGDFDSKESRREYANWLAESLTKLCKGVSNHGT